MNQDPQPPKLPNDGAMTPEQFRQWLQDPQHLESFFALVEKISPPIPADASPEEAARLRDMASARHHNLLMAPVNHKLRALHEVVQWSDDTALQRENRRLECQRRLSDLTDALLDVPDPFRTVYLKKLAPLRELIDAMKE